MVGPTSQQQSSPVSAAEGEPIVVDGKGERGRPRVEGLRERREQEILEVALRLFSERGYDQTDIDSIADTLQVAKGTIYRYFPSKKELFFASLNRAVAGLKEFVDGEVAKVSDPLDGILAAIRAFIEYFDLHPDLAEMFLQERAHFDEPLPTFFAFVQANSEPWHELHYRLVSEGRLRDLLKPEKMDVISDILYGTVIANHMLQRRGQHAEQAETLIRVLFEGLWTDEERKRRHTS